ncbi:MAG: alpha/beta hydrolase [Clostridia bacterium]|jgi:pimeloyl-ACP methyl ester carboxylesterase|nr:alpha/beta hydrolase [Clostridia bacterium]
MKTSVFKTTVGRDKVRAYYNRVLSQFPFGQRYVETTFGQTFILTAGQESNPPIILLHGSNSNSAFWFPEIMALSDRFRVYAVDIIGEAGNSEEYRPVLSSDAFALWMKDVLAALGLERTVLIGNSLGGWMALKFATAYPEYVSSLILIASAGLAEVRPQFLLNVEQARQADGTVQISDSILGEHGIPKEVLDFMNLIAENYNPIQELPVYAEEELGRLTMPALFIDGEEDIIIDAEKSAQRLLSLIPSAVIRLLPNCGHVVTNSIEYILPFLMKTSLL